MRIKKFDGDVRKDEILNLLWACGRPLTAAEILEANPEGMGNITYVHRALNEMEKEGLIKVVGTERRNTQYARQFSFVYNREEYAARFMHEVGLSVHSVGKVALAMINEYETSEKSKETLVTELETIIAGLKKKTYKDGEKTNGN